MNITASKWKFLRLDDLDVSKCICLCECGTERSISFSNFQNGTSKSCGCSRAKISQERRDRAKQMAIGGHTRRSISAELGISSIGLAKILTECGIPSPKIGLGGNKILVAKHMKERRHLRFHSSRALHGEAEGGNSSPEYSAWQSMKNRCFNPKCEKYGLYGGRGITVCDTWKSDYLAFLSDVGRKPTSRHSLDRFPDMDGNYEPGNVRWATQKEQVRNSSMIHWIEHNGVSKPLRDWAECTGIPRQTLGRLINHKGMSIAEACIFRGIAIP